MQLNIFPYTIELKRRFTIAAGSRTQTPAVIVELTHNGVTGYGEASMPPYLGETRQRVIRFLSAIDLSCFDDPLATKEILTKVNKGVSGDSAARSAFDIALHDLAGKISGKAWHEIHGIDPNTTLATSFTISMSTADEIRDIIHDAAEYRIFKVKLGGGHDRETIETIRNLTDKPLRVDVNQGWCDREEALRMIDWLATKNVELVEQPLPAGRADDTAWIHERSPLPIIADESVQGLADVDAALEIFGGINVKLMKCGGMNEAHRMILRAQEIGLKVMIGCMTETSCAISAASQLSPLADWVDLDGAALIRNDCFDGMKIQDGLIVIPRGPGIGVVPNDLFPRQ